MKNQLRAVEFTEEQQKIVKALHLLTAQTESLRSKRK